MRTEQHEREAKRSLTRRIDREILALALPALGALIAEPIFLMLDSAMVGHLGRSPLAGLAVASAILQTAVGLMIFLAYSTTPLVARRLGAGDMRGAVQAGVSGLWLAAGIGLLLTLLLFAAAWPLCLALGQNAGSAALAAAHSYLVISCLGVPAMLLVYAATGLLRGLQNTRVPLYISVLGFAANAFLNWVFIYLCGMGIAGSALGTVVAQWGMVAIYLVIVLRLTREYRVSLLPSRSDLRHTGRSGGWLFIRTLSLRAGLVATVFASTLLGDTGAAGFQIVFTLLTTAAFALDALAISAQALLGKALGAGTEMGLVIRRTTMLGIYAACGMLVFFVLTSHVLPHVFTADAALLAALPPSLVCVGLALPLAAVVYVLDGVLMGADEAKYLGWTGIINLAIYLPLLSFAVFAGQHTKLSTGVAAITCAWCFGYMLSRLSTLGPRTLQIIRKQSFAGLPVVAPENTEGN